MLYAPEPSAVVLPLAVPVQDTSADATPALPLMVYTWLITYAAEPTALSTLLVNEAIALSVQDDEMEIVPPFAMDDELSVGVEPSVV